MLTSNRMMRVARNVGLGADVLTANRALAALVLALGTVIFGAVSLWNPTLGLLGAMTLGILLVTGLQVAQIRTLENHYRQTEALIGLNATLQPSLPFPPMRGWTISPDFAELIVRNIARVRPQVVVEASCGVSSLICGYALKRLGIEGRVISLEHDEAYAKECRMIISQHGLDPWVQVVHAPLKKWSNERGTWRWYCGDSLKDVTSIDLAIIDGPPQHVGRLARYPALPFLWSRLNQQGVLLLDDAGRTEEQDVLRNWEEDYVGACTIEQIATERGAACVRRTV